MFCGYYSIILASQATPDKSYFFSRASWFIVAAAVLDVLDGKLARLTKTTSPFGVQYDSLADVVSFGIAPSYLAYRVFFYKWDFVGMLISFMPLVFGSIRLARFNIRKTEDKSYFEGLPTTAAAVTIATFVVFNYRFWDTLRWSKMFLVILIFLSIMMISLIRYEKMPNFSLYSSSRNRLKMIFVIFGMIIIIFSPHEVFFPIAVSYCLSGPVRALWIIINPKKDNQIDEKLDSVK
jgi:CDP-diacylglycerol--serine O-phosphatidyltransferase